jgi:predicted HTH transcriptional regulator
MRNYCASILRLCGKKERYTVEFKCVKGGFPGSSWVSYSAFANTVGGITVLGITEKDTN